MSFDHALQYKIRKEIIIRNSSAPIIFLSLYELHVPYCERKGHILPFSVSHEPGHSDGTIKRRLKGPI